MLTVMNKREISTKGVVETNAFKIKANGKAFKVLIDGLYSDKVRAVIRELWSNAYDSHIAAGKAGQPFDCQLPTWTDPVFRVRDYGTSLSHDGVMNLYTTVFESSKEDTNEQVGKLGLGSKSPFAYTDTFTVTAWMNGKKRIYSAFIGENYVPQIALMSETADNGITGLEVSFPVKSSDMEAFREAATRVSYGFDILPNFFGAKVENKLQEVSMEGAGWKLWKTSDWGLRAQARQGCVIYPLDADAVPNLTSAQRELLRSPVFIDFPIGDLEISASRESLGYDETTCANIRKRVEQIEQEIIAGFETKIKALKTRWEAMTLAQEIRNSNQPNFVRQLVERMRFKGQEVGYKKNFRVDELGHGFMMASLDAWSLKNGTTQNPEKHQSRSVFIEPGNIVIYLHDTNERVTYAPWRLAEHFRTSGTRQHRVIYIRGRITPQRYARLKVLLGRAPDDVFVWLHKLPAPDLQSAGSPRKPVKMKQVHRSHVSEVDVDFEQGGIYVPMNRDRFPGDTAKGMSGNQSEYVLTRAFDALMHLGVVPPSAVLYGAPASIINKMKGEQWVNLYDLIDKTLADVDVADVLEYRAIEAEDRSHTNTKTLISKWIKMGYQFDKNGVAHKAIEAHKVAEARLIKLSDHKHHLRIVEDLYHSTSVVYNKFMAATKPTNYRKLLEEVTLTYPLTQYASSHINDDMVIHFAKYVKLVDSANQSGIVRQVA